MGNIKIRRKFSISHLLILMKIVNGPNTCLRFIQVTFTYGQLQNVCWIVAIDILLYELAGFNM